MLPVAILDFGTNTFNLLIAVKEGSTFRRLYHGKQPVKLGRGGIHKRLLTPEAMERGYTAIANHMETIATFGVTEIHAYATSAIRNAENGHLFVEEVKNRFHFDIHVISGEEEASLIYKGIMQSVNLGDQRALILDIGGGSNECIICDGREVFWKHSFELGMARILEKFDLSDPITPTEIASLESHFADELQLLIEKTKVYKPDLLIGASGSFDTVASLIRNRYGMEASDANSSKIEKKHFHEIYDHLLGSTLAERKVMPGMEPVRVEMIVPASIFINFVINNCLLESICQSDFALKEGVMATLSEK